MSIHRYDECFFVILQTRSGMIINLWDYGKA
jgi:hypothetical protein